MGVMLWWIGEEDARETEEELIATRRLTFFMRSPQDSFFEVMSDPACPRKYTRHPNDQRLFLVNIAPEQRAGAYRIWDIDLEYTSNPKRRDEEENPLNEPAEIEWDTTEESQIIERDGEGNPLVNTAGDLLEGIEEIASHWVIKVKKNVAKVPRYILDYDMSVNDGSVRISGLTFPKETLWLRRLHISDKKTKADVDYYEFSFELHCKPGTWRRTFANRGYYEIVDVEFGPFLIKQKKRILGPDGEPPAEPQWIDVTGAQPRETVVVEGRNADGTINTHDTQEIRRVKSVLDPNDYVFLTYQTKKKRNFGVLPLK